MGFWTRLADGIFPNYSGETPNALGGPVGEAEATGDAMGVEIDQGDAEGRSYMPLPFLMPSPWAGWPSDWSTPNWSMGGAMGTTGGVLGGVPGLANLIDTAWAAIDLNASILASFPVYRLRNGKILPSLPYMTNPDPSIYTSWVEFAKQMFWDYQLAGECFIMSMAEDSTHYPLAFRVIPPWLITCTLIEGRREYSMCGMDVTDVILHIRYLSNTAYAHGYGALQAAGARMVTAGLLQRYANKLAETGGIPHHWLDVPGRKLNPTESNELIDQWITSRLRHAGGPSVLSGGVELKQAASMNAKDLALLELAQFTEARIAILCGVPPFLLGLPMAQGESMCVDTNTEILTRRGWKRHNRLLIGEDVLTLNHDTGLSEWQPLQDVNHFAVRDRAMVSIEMTGHSSYSTDDHQWPVIHTGSTTGIRTRTLRMSRDLKKHDALVLGALCADTPTEAKYLDDFVELVAWFYTEGHVGAYDTVWISQSQQANSAHVERIRATLTRVLPGTQWSEYHRGAMTQWRLKREASQAVLAVMDDPARKVVAREFLYSLTQAQLEAFIRVSVWADGCESGGQRTFKQTDLDRLERFELAAILAGIATMRHRRQDGIEVTLRRRGQTRPVDADRHVPPGRQRIIRHDTFTGTVWCPTTPNGTWFARRNGTSYFTHNTYNNANMIFDYHDRSSLRPKAAAVMSALSGWLLPRGQSVELNREEYSRPGMLERAQANQIYLATGVLETGEVRAMERFDGSPNAASTLTGAETAGTGEPPEPQEEEQAPPLKSPSTSGPTGGM